MRDCSEWKQVSKSRRLGINIFVFCRFKALLGIENSMKRELVALTLVHKPGHIDSRSSITELSAGSVSSQHSYRDRRDIERRDQCFELFS